MRWALLALGLLLFVLCDGLHGAHRDPPYAASSLSSAEDGERDGETYPDPSIKPRRRVAAGPVQSDDGAQAPALVAPPPVLASLAQTARDLAAQPPRLFLHTDFPVPRLSRGQDPPPGPA